MKKLLTFFFALFLSVQIFAQSSPVLTIRIPDRTTAFGQNLPVETSIIVKSDSTRWTVKVPILGTATVTSAMASLYSDITKVTGTLPITVTGADGKRIVAINAATTTTPGSLSAVDKVRVDSIPLLERKVNKVTSISGASTDVQYPTAKLLYDQLTTKQETLTNPVTGTGTTNYAAIWKSSSTLGTGVLYDNGTSVGIGTTAPTNKLDVVGNVSIGPSNIIGSGVGYGCPGCADKGYLQLYSNSTGKTTLQSGVNYSLLLNPNGGNVGIGTTAPTEALSLPQGANITLGDYDAPSGIFFRKDYSPNGVYHTAGNIRNVSLIATNDSIELSGYNGVTLNTNGNNARLKILNNGNIGIGTTSPTSRLHLAAGSATAGTAPLGFTSGTLLTTPVVGKVEFLSDAWYGTISTGTARKTFAFLESPVFTGTVTAPAIKLTTSPTEGYILKVHSDGSVYPDSPTASQIYNGAWDASSNTPTLADAVGTAGNYYHVTVAGTVDFDGAGGRAAVTFATTDDVAYNGSIWQKIANVQYQLLTASATVLGGIKIGAGITMTGNVASVSTAYDATGTASGLIATHAALTTTAHGLGASAFHADNYFSLLAGSTSVTTLGTIATGTWNGGVIAGQYGGTGVANTGKTITLGGNLTTAGAYASTFTMTGTTGVTFPTTGTLATTAQITGTNSGTNSGDNATNTQYSGLVTNATHSGDATGATALTVVKINGTLLSGLATGLLKNTTSTGVPSIAINSDLPEMSATVRGAVPTPPNDATKYLNGQGAWVVPSSGIYICQNFEISADGSTGSTVTLGHTPKNVSGVTVSQNGAELTYTTQFTVSGTTVTFAKQVYTYDKIVASYCY